MSKKILGLLLIMAILITLGCTGKDQSSAQPTATPQPTQPAISPVPTDTGASQNVTADNETMPELDLPLPPDLSDI